MNDIRDILKGLDPEHRAIYTECRTTMRRAYLSALAKVLPIEQYNGDDDYFLDLIDIKIAQMFDRAGFFDHSEGKLGDDKAKVIGQDIEQSAKLEEKQVVNHEPIAEFETTDSAATKLLKGDWGTAK